MTEKEIIETNIVPLIEKAGYEVVETAFGKSYGTDELTFYIYKKGGITLEDCETVNDLLEEPLDAIDWNNGKPYNLNVSSPGLDRPIVTSDDFRRNEGEEVELLFRDPQKKKEKTVGKLLSLTESSVTLEIKGKEKSFDRDRIKKIQLNIKF